MSLLEECAARLRQKADYSLVNGETHLTGDSDYPFPRGKLPVLCDFLEDEREPLTAFESGNRSIVLPYKGEWFKAKAIGIHTGVSRPFHHDGKLHSYYLENEVGMGAGNALWGFLQDEEAKSEMWGLKAARGRDLPSPTPVGTGKFDVHLLYFKNRLELFGYLNKTQRDQLLKNFLENSRKEKAYCIFSAIPSDIRVDEILYAFIFPGVERILDPRDCKDYVKWLGSSCGYNLRQHHDQGLLHGTVGVGAGLNSNSYPGNHMVGETETYMCDYDLAREVADESKKKLELYGLLHIMNPLDPFSYLTGGRVEFATAGVTGELYAMLDPHDPAALLDIFAPTQPPKTFRRELADKYEEGVNLGYKGEVYEIEDILKRSMLRKVTLVKERMWQLYEIPKRMIRGIGYIDRIIKRKKHLEKEVKPGFISP